jgi:preprotein translocase subunit SecE
MLKKVIDFINETKAEVSKVTWPKRKETMMTSLSIFFMVILAAIFFLFIDWFFSTIIKFIF